MTPFGTHLTFLVVAARHQIAIVLSLSLHRHDIRNAKRSQASRRPWNVSGR
jgi:hypothetical protein